MVHTEFQGIHEARREVLRLRAHGRIPYVLKPNLYRFRVYPDWSDVRECMANRELPHGHALCADMPRRLRFDLEHDDMPAAQFDALCTALTKFFEDQLRPQLEHHCLDRFSEEWLRPQLSGRIRGTRRSRHIVYPCVRFVDQVAEFRCMHDLARLLPHVCPDALQIFDLGIYRLSENSGSMRMAMTTKAPGEEDSLLAPLFRSSEHWEPHLPLFDFERPGPGFCFMREHFPETQQERRRQVEQERQNEPVVLEDQYQWLVPWVWRVRQHFHLDKHVFWRPDVPMAFVTLYEAEILATLDQLRAYYTTSCMEYRERRYKLARLIQTMQLPYPVFCHYVRRMRPSLEFKPKHQQLFLSAAVFPASRNLVRIAASLVNQPQLPMGHFMCPFGDQEACRGERYPKLRVRAGRDERVFLHCGECQRERYVGQRHCTDELWFSARFVNQYLVAVPENTTTLCINSPCGTGKTAFLAGILRGAQARASMLVITPRCTLASYLHHELPDFSLYSNCRNLYDTLNSPTPRLVIQLDSLVRIARDFRAAGQERLPLLDYIIVDEFISLVLHLTSQTLEGKRRQVFDTLEFLMRSCRLLIILDADFEALEEPYRWLCRLREVDKIRVYRNLAFPNPRKQFRFLDYGEWLAELDRTVESGEKVGLVSNSKQELQTLMSKLNPRSSFEFTSSSQHEDLTEIPLLSSSGFDKQIIGFTPKITVGVDYKPEEDEERRVFAFMTWKSAGAVTAIQMACRFRNQRDVLVFVNPRDRVLLRLQEQHTTTERQLLLHQNRLDLTQRQAQEFLEIDPLTGSILIREDSESLRRLLAWSKALECASQVDYFGQMRRFLTCHGHTLEDQRELDVPGRLPRPDDLLDITREYVRSNLERMGQQLSELALAPHFDQERHGDVRLLYRNLQQCFRMHRDNPPWVWSLAACSIPELLRLVCRSDRARGLAEAQMAGFEIRAQELYQSPYFQMITMHHNAREEPFLGVWNAQVVHCAERLLTALGFRDFYDRQEQQDLLRQCIHEVPRAIAELRRDRAYSLILQDVFGFSGNSIRGNLTARNLLPFLRRLFGVYGLQVERDVRQRRQRERYYWLNLERLHVMEHLARAEPAQVPAFVDPIHPLALLRYL